MVSPINLQNVYTGITEIFWLITFPAKMVLLVAIGMCFRKPFKNREQLITILVAVPFLLSAWCVFVLSPGLVYDKKLYTDPQILALTGISIISAIALFLAAWQVEGRWNLISEHEWLIWLGRGMILFGFFYPLFSISFFRVLFFAPVGVLLHPVIFIVGGMLIAGFPNVARLPMAAIVFSSIALGVLDYFGGIGTWFVPVIPGIVLSGLMIWSSIKSGGFLEDDRPPVDVRTEEKKKAVFREKTKEQKTWKLK